MKPGGSMPHSQRLSNNPYREPDQFNSSYWYYFFKIHSNIVPLWTLDLLKGFVPLGVPVKILKGLLSYSFLATWPAHLNLLDLITLTLLGERYKLWSSSLWSLLHSPLASLLGPNTPVRMDRISVNLDLTALIACGVRTTRGRPDFLRSLTPPVSKNNNNTIHKKTRNI